LPPPPHVVSPSERGEEGSAAIIEGKSQFKTNRAGHPPLATKRERTIPARLLSAWRGDIMKRFAGTASRFRVNGGIFYGHEGFLD
jgi:hypothetical protein